MNKNFFEVKNVDFKVGGKTKVANVSFAIENEGDIYMSSRSIGNW